MNKTNELSELWVCELPWDYGAVLKSCVALRLESISDQNVRSRLGVWGTAFPGMESRSEFMTFQRSSKTLCSKMRGFYSIIFQ